MKKFMVIEGLDGAGKSTQIKLLKKYLDHHQIHHQYIHFPQTDSQEDSPVYGEMVANFLKGEYGDVNQVHPYLVALLYAGDRNNSKELIRNWLENDYFVLLDRYVYSNIAFQGAKFQGEEEKRKLKEWIEQLEYEHNKIPKPSLSVFLHMNFEFVSRHLKDARKGLDRDYLGGKEDIHENSLELQKNVEKEYLRLVREDDNFHLIDCCDDSGQTLPPGDIHQKIIALLKEQRML
ncbi:MAG: dTMP kinase [bacterium]|nr:dTMP kinase [bacterium]